MSDLTSAPTDGAAIGLDHVGIVGADLDVLARAFAALGFNLTAQATHASGRTANRCVMLRDASYLELMATVPGQSSATLDRFLARGPGAHILALEVADEAAALNRLRRAGIESEVSATERVADQHGTKARFALIMPPDPPEGRMLLIRHLTRDLLWRPDTVVHPNHAVALIEAVYATDAPAETMARLSRLAGRPAEPDPLGGYRIPLSRGCLRILPHAVAAELFPEMADGPSLIGLTIAVEAVTGAPQEITGEISHAAPGKGTPGRPADERPNNEWPTGGWPPARRASAGQMTIGEIATAQATAGQPASGGTPIGRATHAGGVVIRWIVGSV